MARPLCCRRVSGRPAASIFKPAGIPARTLEQVVLALDEFEAIRLADLQGFYQEQAAERMRVSRPTFGRIIDSARRKVAEAVIMGKALRIEGGPVYEESGQTGHCDACGNEWEEPAGEPPLCPRCHRNRIETEDAPVSSPCCGWRRRGKRR